MRYIGLSLAFCVKDILRNRVPIEKVHCIYAGFQWKGEVAPLYHEVYWCDWSKETVDAVLSQLDIRPKPSEAHNIVCGYWIQCEEGISEEECLRKVQDHLCSPLSA